MVGKIWNKADIAAELGRILSSKALSRSERARALLRYIVEREQAGESGRLKAFSIAQDVFGRDDSFDPQSDAVVRVQAGRLRDLIETYYADEGAANPLQIRVPVGSYVPFYERGAYAVDEPAQAVGVEHEAEQAQQLPGRAPPVSADVPVSTFVVRNIRNFWYLLLAIFAVSLVILALTWVNLTGVAEPAQAELAEPDDPVAALMRLPTSVVFDELAVERGSVSVKSERMLTAMSRFALHDFKADIAAPDDADYVFTVRDASDDLMRVSVVNGQSRDVVWSGMVSLSGDDPAAETMASMLTLLLAPDGIIYADMANRAVASPLMQCLQSTQLYFREQTRERLDEAIECHDDLLAQGAVSSLSLSDMASLIANGFIKRFEGFQGTPAQALDLVEQALEMSPLDSNTHRARATVLSSMGERDAALEAMSTAYRFNANDLNIVAAYGFSLYRAKQFDAARDVLLEATTNNSRALPWWHHTLFLAAAAVNDQPSMIAAGRALLASETPSHIAARIIAAQLSGDSRGLSNALEVARQFATIDPVRYYKSRLSIDAALRLAAILDAAGYPR